MASLTSLKHAPYLNGEEVRQVLEREHLILSPLAQEVVLVSFMALGSGPILISSYRLKGGRSEELVDSLALPLGFQTQYFLASMTPLICFC